jgi:hypothetical protein
VNVDLRSLSTNDSQILEADSKINGLTVLSSGVLILELSEFAHSVTLKISSRA